MTEQEFDAIVKPVKDLVVAKGRDYNSRVQLEMYFPYEDKNYIQMIHLKALRMVSLTDQTDVNFEGMLDTVMDSIAYTVFYLDFLQKKVGLR